MNSDPTTNQQELEAEKARVFAFVDTFAEDMKARLYQKMQEGRAGWDDPAWLPELEGRLSETAQAIADEPIDLSRVARKCVDLADFALFRWYLAKGHRV
jgi:hypothetical protein